MVAATHAHNAYQNANVYEGMDPNRLILMLYEGALQHLDLAKEGIAARDAKKRGEHLGRVIAIISELNTALDSNVKEEPIEFLRGLYQAMLVELPQVAITNDASIIDRVTKYLSSLCDIWKNNVMCEEYTPDATEVTRNQAQGAEPTRQPRMPGPGRAASAYASAGKLTGLSVSA